MILPSPPADEQDELSTPHSIPHTITNNKSRPKSKALENRDMGEPLTSMSHSLSRGGVSRCVLAGLDCNAAVSKPDGPKNWLECTHGL